MDIMKTIDKVEVGKRVKLARKRFKKRLTHQEIGDYVGVTRNAVSNWETGKDNVDFQHQKSLADILEVNLTWLLYGEGPMEKGESREIPEGKILALSLNESAASNYFLIPKYPVTASMGPGRENCDGEEVEKYLSFELSWLNKKNFDKKNLAIINAKGDSMSPHIEDGDVVMVDMSKVELEDGEIFAFSAGNEIKIKRFRKKEDGRWYITSDNPHCGLPDEPVNESIHIIGKKAWRGG